MPDYSASNFIEFMATAFFITRSDDQRVAFLNALDQVVAGGKYPDLVFPALEIARIAATQFTDSKSLRERCWRTVNLCLTKHPELVDSDLFVDIARDALDVPNAEGLQTFHNMLTMIKERNPSFLRNPFLGLKICALMIERKTAPHAPDSYNFSSPPPQSYPPCIEEDTVVMNRRGEVHQSSSSYKVRRKQPAAPTEPKHENEEPNNMFLPNFTAALLHLAAGG